MLIVNGKEVLTELNEIVNPRHTALLIIDVQNDFCSVGGINDLTTHRAGVGLMPPMVSNVKELIAASRRAGTLLIFSQNTDYADRRTASPAYLRRRAIKRGYGFERDSTVIDTWGWQFVEEVTPNPGDIIVRKHRSSAFTGTDLDLLLRSNSVKSVVLTGAVTEGCVEATARAAEMLDYYVVVVEDACASSVRELHQAAIMVLATRYDVVTTRELCSIWEAADVAHVYPVETVLKTER